jgi:hypothetical protein
VSPAIQGADLLAEFAIPHICLATKTDNHPGIKTYEEVLTADGKIEYLKTYSTMYQGWIGAGSIISDLQLLGSIAEGRFLLFRILDFDCAASSQC